MESPKAVNHIDKVERAIFNVGYGITSSMEEKTQTVDGLLELYGRVQTLERVIDALTGADAFTEVVEKKLKELGFVKRGKS